MKPARFRLTGYDAEGHAVAEAHLAAYTYDQARYWAPKLIRWTCDVVPATVNVRQVKRADK